MAGAVSRTQPGTRLQTRPGAFILNSARQFTNRWRLSFAHLAATLLISAMATRGASAQVSLSTVVDLAQRNSTGVRAAAADVSKAAAVVSQSKDALIPSVSFGTGLPVFPEIGFTGRPPSIWTATVQSLVNSVPQK